MMHRKLMYLYITVVTIITISFIVCQYITQGAVVQEYSLSSHKVKTKTPSGSEKNRYMTALEHVCIEIGRDGVPILSVYNSLYESESVLGHFTVKYRTSQIPLTAYVHDTSVAYFMPARWTDNIYYNTEDVLSPIHYLLKMTNRLNISKSNDIYLRILREAVHPSPSCAPPNICNVMQVFIKRLPVRWPPFRFDSIPPGECYTNGVIFTGTAGEVIDMSPKRTLMRRDAAVYIKSSFDMLKCQKKPNQTKKVTIIQNNQGRRIVLKNLKSEVDASLKLWTDYMEVVDFKQISALRQYRIIACTDVLVGLSSDELLLGMFLEPNSALVELLWPQQKAKYSHLFKHDPRIKVFPVTVKQDKEVLEDKKDWFSFDSDIEVDVETEHLLSVLSQVVSAQEKRNIQ